MTPPSEDPSLSSAFLQAAFEESFGRKRWKEKYIHTYFTFFSNFQATPLSFAAEKECASETGHLNEERSKKGHWANRLE
jgi:hypothetical protein